jgi:hypothetical protein
MTLSKYQIPQALALVVLILILIKALHGVKTTLCRLNCGYILGS